MKDIIRRIIATILPLAGIATLGRYIYQGQSVVKDYMQSNQYIVLAAFALVFLAFLFHFGILSIAAKRLKLKGIVMGLLIILGATYFIANDASKGMFAWDILAVIGILMLYLTLAWMIVTSKAQSKVVESKQQIIEV
jgi:peptidoglycan/LPS O-acetylase OafA/YrhL